MRRKTAFNRLRVASLVAALGLPACGTDDMPHAPSGSTPQSADGGAGGGTGGEYDSGGTGDTGDTGGGTEEKETGGLDALLKECGGIDYNQPDAIVLDQALQGVAAVKKGRAPLFGGLFGVDYEITLIPSLTIKGSAARSVTDTAVQVTANPTLAQATAEAEAKKVSGTTTTEFVAVDRRGDLATRDRAWDGILCTVQPATKVTAELGAGTTVVTFDPPLPASVSPKADPARFAAEMAQARTVSNITATVVSSTNPALAAGKTVTGTVSVTPIAATQQLDMLDGRTITVGGDLAFDVKVNFGDAATTIALGLKPSTRFFIDHASRSYKAVVVSLDDPTTPPAVLVMPGKAP